jgi:hypothetical protein
MRGENIEELWYGFLLIKAIVSLSFLFVVVLLCKRLLHCIPWNRVTWRSAKHSMVHSLGIQEPLRNFDASQSKAVDRSPNERKQRTSRSTGS